MDAIDWFRFTSVGDVDGEEPKFYVRCLQPIEG